MKKILIALGVALLVVMAMAIPVFAADPPPGTSVQVSYDGQGTVTGGVNSGDSGAGFIASGDKVNVDFNTNVDNDHHPTVINTNLDASASGFEGDPSISYGAGANDHQGAQVDASVEAGFVHVEGSTTTVDTRHFDGTFLDANALAIGFKPQTDALANTGHSGTDTYAAGDFGVIYQSTDADVMNHNLDVQSAIGSFIFGSGVVGTDASENLDVNVDASIHSNSFMTITHYVSEVSGPGYHSY